MRWNGNRGCGRLSNRPPKRPRPHRCDYIALGKRAFADVIKLRALRQGDYPGPIIITRVLLRGRWKGQSESRRCDDRSRGHSDGL